MMPESKKILKKVSGGVLIKEHRSPPEGALNGPNWKNVRAKLNFNPRINIHKSILI